MLISSCAARFVQRHFYFIPQMFALLVVAPMFYMLVLDRTPPLVLYDGRVDPAQVYPGQVGVRVIWRATFSGRDCPGYSQRELVDGQDNIWPKLKRVRGGVFHPSAGNPRDGTVTTPPLDIPSQMEFGRAQYRVTQFYYCNFLQRWLRWPIVQKSIPIRFRVVPVRGPVS